MKRYRLWALDVPDLHPDGFQPRLGGMRLFEGGDGGGGGDGPGGSDTRDENTSDYSPSGGEGGDPVKAALYGDAGYGQGLTGAQTKAFDDTLAATGDVGAALDAMEAVTAQVDFATRAAELAALGIDINNPFAGSYQLPVEFVEAAELPEDVEAKAEETQLSPQGQAYAQAYLDVLQRGGTEEEAQRAGDQAFDETVAPAPDQTQSILSSGMAQEISPPDLSGRLPDTLQDIVDDVASRTYDAAYDDAISRGSSHEEANAAASVAMGGVYAGAKGVGTVSPGQREETDLGYIGGALDVLGDVSGLGVDRPAYDTGRGTVFEDVTRPSGEGVASVDLLQDEPLGLPPAGFTGPSLPPTQDLEDDRADQMFEWAAGNVPAREGAWQVDEQGRVFTIDERGVRMSPSGIALDPEEERWGSTPARERGSLPAGETGQATASPFVGPSGRGSGSVFGGRSRFGRSGGSGTSFAAPSDSVPLADLPGSVEFQPPVDLGLLPQDLEEMRQQTAGGQLGLSMDDMALKDREDRLSDEPTGMAGASGWTSDTRPREGDPGFMGAMQPGFSGEMGLSSRDIELKESLDRLGLGVERAAGASGWTPDTAPREGDPGFMGAVQGQVAETPSGALPGPSGGTPALVGPLTLSEEIAKARTEVAAGRDLTQNLSFLAREGLGAEEGLNANNPTQSVQEMLNSSRLSDFLDRNMPTIVGATMGPAAQVLTEAAFAMKKGYQPSSIVGMIVSSMIGSAIEMATGVRVPGEAVQEFSKGNIGKAAFGVGVQNVAKRVGAPVAAINSVLSGNMGEAASNAILSEVVNESAKQLSTDPGLIARFAVQSGLGQSAFEKITSAINDNSIVKGVNDILGDWSSKLKGATADVPIGEAITSGGTSGGALPGQDTYYTSDGGTDSDQTGALPDTTVSGQPKKRIPRWSDLFLGNLARDLNKGFSAPPPVAPPEGDLDQALAIANAYNDPSRKLDVIDPLGDVEASGDPSELVAGSMDPGQETGQRSNRFLDPNFDWSRFSMDRALEQMSDNESDQMLNELAEARDNPQYKSWFVNNYLPELSRNGSPGLYRTQDGNWISVSNGRVFTYGQDGEIINSVDASQVSPGDASPEGVIGAIRNQEQLVGEGRAGDIPDVPYRILFGMGQSAAPPASSTAQPVFGDVSGTFGKFREGISRLFGITPVAKDTGTPGVVQYDTDDFIIFAYSDGSARVQPKDDPARTVEIFRAEDLPSAIEQVTQPTPAPEPSPALRPEDLLVTPPSPPPPVVQPPPQDLPRDDQTAQTTDAAQTPGAQQPADVAAPGAVADQNVTDQTTLTGGTSGESAAAPDAVAGTTGDTSGQTGAPAGGTPAGGVPSAGDPSGGDQSGIDDQPGPEREAHIPVTQGPTGSSGSSGYGPETETTGAGGYITQADLQRVMSGLQIPPGLSPEDVSRSISDYMRDNPGVSLTDVSNEMGRQLADYAKKSDIDEAIRGIQFPAGITPQDVSNAISQYMTENPGLSAQDVAGIVGDEIGKLPAYATSGDVNTAITNALTGYATSEEVGAIGKGVGELGEALGKATEAQEEQARLQLNLQRQQGALQTASNLGASGRQQIIDPYKATFKDPFVVGGEATEFKSPLAGFLGSAMKSSFLPEASTAGATQAPDRLGSEYFDMPGITGMQNPLDMYVEAPFEGLYGFKAGGMVPLMAQGGTRYGNNAHGALRVLEHSGKHRVDYRQGDAVTGIGDGQSDDIPAMLADGEFVFPADVVAALGNGSTKAGSDKLYEMMHNIRRHHRSTGPKDLPPPAKSPLEYIKPRKGRR